LPSPNAKFAGLMPLSEVPNARSYAHIRLQKAHWVLTSCRANVSGTQDCAQNMALVIIITPMYSSESRRSGVHARAFRLAYFDAATQDPA